MKVQKTVLLSCLLGLLLTSQMALSQVSVGLHFTYGNPVDEFSDNVSKSPAGIAISGLYQLPNSRFSVGGELGVAMYANASYRYEVPSGKYQGSVVDVDEEDCYFSYHALARYNLMKEGMITPYVEARLGFTSFFSDKGSFDNPEIVPHETTFHGTSFNSGVGGGIQFNVSQLFSSSPSRPFLLDFNVGYTNGTKAIYRNMDSDSDAQVSDLDAGRYKSGTDLVTYRFGGMIRF